MSREQQHGKLLVALLRADTILVKGALKLMAWTKAETAIVAGVVVLLAVGITTVVVKKVSHTKLAETALSWTDDPKYWSGDSDVLRKLPPVMIIRPTRFAGSGGAVSVDNVRIMYKNITLKVLLNVVYGNVLPTRAIFPENMPSGSYDLMYTLPAPPSSILPQEIAKRFGYIAHKEKREMDVLLLKVVNPNSPNLKLTQNKSGSSIGGNGQETIYKNQDASALAWDIESNFVHQPVLDQTGLKEKYDFTLQTEWKEDAPSIEALNHALLGQLGLELVPRRESIEMLVVEKVK